MPIEVIEGFDYYPANQNEVGYGLFSTWIKEGGGGMSFLDGRFLPGKAVKIYTDNGFPVGRAVLPFTPHAKVVIGFAFFFESAIGNMPGGVGRQLIAFRDQFGGVQFYLAIDSVGNLNVVNAALTVVMFQCPKRRIIQNNWHYIEIAMTIDDAAGAVNIWIDGEDQGGITGVDTKATNFANVGQFYTAVPDYKEGTYRLDDMYILINETQPLGECRIQLLEVNADAAIQFSRSGGANNYANVGANSSDGDTSYNYANDIGNQDLFLNTGIAVNPDKIHAIGINIAARKEDSGTRTIKGVVKSGGSVGFTPDYNLTVNYTWTRKIILVDPETETAWTKGRVNAMQLGYELVL